MPAMGSMGPRTVVVNKPATSSMAQQQPGQKVIIMTSRPPTPSQVSLLPCYVKQERVKDFTLNCISSVNSLPDMNDFSDCEIH